MAWIPKRGRNDADEGQARRLDASDGGEVSLLEFEMMPASLLHDGDLVLYTAGDVIAAGGVVIEGTASLDASATAGSGAPETEASGGEKSAVTKGTRVLSGWIVVRIGGHASERTQ